jgi:hypothetical protein
MPGALGSPYWPMTSLLRLADYGRLWQIMAITAVAAAAATLKPPPPHIHTGGPPPAHQPTLPGIRAPCRTHPHPHTHRLTGRPDWGPRIFISSLALEGSSSRRPANHCIRRRPAEGGWAGGARSPWRCPPTRRQSCLLGRRRSTAECLGACSGCDIVAATLHSVLRECRQAAGDAAAALDGAWVRRGPCPAPPCSPKPIQVQLPCCRPAPSRLAAAVLPPALPPTPPGHLCTGAAPSLAPSRPLPPLPPPGPHPPRSPPGCRVRRAQRRLRRQRARQAAPQEQQEVGRGREGGERQRHSRQRWWAQGSSGGDMK